METRKYSQILTIISFLLMLFMVQSCIKKQEVIIEVRDHITEAEYEAIMSVAKDEERSKWCGGKVQSVKVGTCNPGECDYLIGTKMFWKCEGAENDECPYKAGDWIPVMVKCRDEGIRHRTGCYVWIDKMEPCK